MSQPQDAYTDVIRQLQQQCVQQVSGENGTVGQQNSNVVMESHDFGQHDFKLTDSSGSVYSNQSHFDQTFDVSQEHHHVNASPDTMSQILAGETFSPQIQSNQYSTQQYDDQGHNQTQLAQLLECNQLLQQQQHHLGGQQQAQQEALAHINHLDQLHASLGQLTHQTTISTMDESQQQMHAHHLQQQIDQQQQQQQDQQSLVNGQHVSAQQQHQQHLLTQDRASQAQHSRGLLPSPQLVLQAPSQDPQGLVSQSQTISSENGGSQNHIVIGQRQEQQEHRMQQMPLLTQTVGQMSTHVQQQAMQRIEQHQLSQQRQHQQQQQQQMHHLQQQVLQQNIIGQLPQQPHQHLSQGASQIHLQHFVQQNHVGPQQHQQQQQEQQQQQQQQQQARIQIQRQSVSANSQSQNATSHLQQQQQQSQQQSQLQTQVPSQTLVVQTSLQQTQTSNHSCATLSTPMQQNGAQLTSTINLANGPASQNHSSSLQGQTLQQNSQVHSISAQTNPTAQVQQPFVIATQPQMLSNTAGLVLGQQILLPGANGTSQIIQLPGGGAGVIPAAAAAGGVVQMVASNGSIFAANPLAQLFQAQQQNFLAALQQQAILQALQQQQHQSPTTVTSESQNSTHNIGSNNSVSSVSSRSSTLTGVGAPTAADGVTLAGGTQQLSGSQALMAATALQQASAAPQQQIFATPSGQLIAITAPAQTSIPSHPVGCQFIQLANGQIVNLGPQLTTHQPTIQLATQAAGPMACLPPQTGSAGSIITNDAIAPGNAFAATQPAAPPATLAISTAQKSPLPIAPKPKQFSNAVMTCPATPTPKINVDNQRLPTATNQDIAQTLSNAAPPAQQNQIVSNANQVVVSRAPMQEASPQGAQLPKGAQPVRIGQNATITLAGSGQSQQLQIQNPSGQQLIPVSIGGQLFTIANPSAITQNGTVQFHQAAQISPRKDISHVAIRPASTTTTSAPSNIACVSAPNHVQAEQKPQQQQCVTFARQSYQTQKGQIVQIHQGQNHNPNVIAMPHQQQQQQQQQVQHQQQQQTQLQSQGAKVQEIQLSGGQKAIVIPNNHLPQLQISGLNNLVASAQVNQSSHQSITLTGTMKNSTTSAAVSGGQVLQQQASPTLQNPSPNAKSQSNLKVTSSLTFQQPNLNVHPNSGSKTVVKSLKNEQKQCPSTTSSSSLTALSTPTVGPSPANSNTTETTRAVEHGTTPRNEPIESMTQLKMKQFQDCQPTTISSNSIQPKVLPGINNISLSLCLRSEIKQEASECNTKRLRLASTDESDAWRPLQQHQRNTHCGIVVPSAPNIPPLSPSPPAQGDSADERPSSTQSVETDESKDTQQQVISSTEANIVDGIDLEEIKNFARAFKMRRLSLGLTQTQVGQLLSATEGPSYSQSAICRFEKLDITPKSAQKIKPVLERWMKEMEERANAIGAPCDMVDLPDSAVDSNKKRKRRTSFAPQAITMLNNYFKENTHPSGPQMNALAAELGHDREVVRVWFCNKRQTLKNNYKKQQHQLQQQLQLRNQGLLPIGPIEAAVDDSNTQDSDRSSTVNSSHEETIVPSL